MVLGIPTDKNAPIVRDGDVTKRRPSEVIGGDNMVDNEAPRNGKWNIIGDKRCLQKDAQKCGECEVFE